MVVVVAATEPAALVTTMVVGDETWPAPRAEHPAAITDDARTASPDRVPKYLSLLVIVGALRASW